MDFITILNWTIIILNFCLICYEHNEHKKRTKIINRCTIDSPELEYLFLSLEESSHSGLWFALLSLTHIYFLYLGHLV